MQAYLYGVVEAIVTASEPCRSIFAGIEAPDTLARAGVRTANPELADALEAIAIEGADLFYRGEIAASIVADMKAGGQLGTADLAGYRWRSASRCRWTTAAHGSSRIRHPRRAAPSSGSASTCSAIATWPPTRSALPRIYAASPR